MTGQNADQRRYCFDGFTLDLERGALSSAGSDLHLRPKSFEVLRYLVLHAGRLVGKQELLDAIWGRTVVTEGSLTQCIADIRRAIGDDRQLVIRTVPRRGFIFEGLVRELPPAEPNVASPALAPAAVPSNRAAAGQAEPSSAQSGPQLLRAISIALFVLAAVAVVAGWLLRPEQTVNPPTLDPAAPTIAANAVAVLRFLDLSPEGDQAWFADGLAEELLNRLAQSPDLRVTARGSSFAFDPARADVASVADQLGVSHVVEGSVRRDGDALRITVQLIDAQTQAHVWSRTYDRVLASVLDVQSEIAADVAAALAATLEPPRVSDSPHAAAAQESYLLGRHLFHRRSPGDLAAAERHFQRAAQLDPQHARAWTALAGTYHVRAFDEFKDQTYKLEEQRAALEQALIIDPNLAEAHIRLGRYFKAKGDATEANASFERGYRLAPGDPLVLGSLAHDALLDGRLGDAIEMQRRMVALDPLSAVYRINLGHLLLATGEYEEALAELRRVDALSPDSPTARMDLALALLLLDRDDEAFAAVAGLPEDPRLYQLNVLLAGPAEATAAYERLRALDCAKCHFLIAEIAAHRGDADAAFASLAAARRIVIAAGPRADFDLATELATSPFFRALHADPRWEVARTELPSL